MFDENSTASVDEPEKMNEIVYVFLKKNVRHVFFDGKKNQLAELIAQNNDPQGQVAKFDFLIKSPRSEVVTNAWALFAEHAPSLLGEIAKPEHNILQTTAGMALYHKACATIMSIASGPKSRATLYKRLSLDRAADLQNAN